MENQNLAGIEKESHKPMDPSGQKESSEMMDELEPATTDLQRRKKLKKNSRGDKLGILKGRPRPSGAQQDTTDKESIVIGQRKGTAREEAKMATMLEAKEGQNSASLSQRVDTGGTHI